MTTVLFCHGIPGSGADKELLAGVNPNVDIAALDLLSYCPDDVDRAFLKAIDRLSDSPAGASRVHLVGFSIGAMAAVKIAASMPDRVSKLTLVSPAAPLQFGEFLPLMAGKSVFSLAMNNPPVLALLTRMQAGLLRLSPNLMLKFLFAKAGPAERVLLNDPVFRDAIYRGLRASFIDKRLNYLAYLQSYVEDWRNLFADLKCPVNLWHGTSDTWAPPQMSSALKAELGKECTLHLVDGAEHYSTLCRCRL